MLQAAHLFAPAGITPVRTFGSEDSLHVLNNASLWEWCTSRVAGLFATLPLTEKETNENEGRPCEQSVPDVSSAAYEYDPARDEDGAPSCEHSDARRQSMELLGFKARPFIERGVTNDRVPSEVRGWLARPGGCDRCRARRGATRPSVTRRRAGVLLLKLWAPLLWRPEGCLEGSQLP